MSRIWPSIFAVAALGVAPPGLTQTPEKIVPSKSYIRFVTRQMNVPVEGEFREFDASIAFDPAKPQQTQAQFLRITGRFRLGE